MKNLTMGLVLGSRIVQNLMPCGPMARLGGSMYAKVFSLAAMAATSERSRCNIMLDI